MSLKRTSLHPVHADLGARFTPFAGYDMPVMFSSILEEHKAVREAAGLFDVSHMGNLWVTGPDAAATLARALASDIREVAEGAGKYTVMLRDDATIVDDLIAFHTPWGFHVVPNAGMSDEVAGLLRERAGGDVDVAVATDDTAILALQGPRAREVLEAYLGREVGGVTRFHLAPMEELGERAFLSRTGYTGEDGFELFFPAERAPEAFAALLEAGQDAGVRPVGLGARDTLRLEKGYALAGNEFEGGRTPLEARLGWVVDWDHDFVGRDALAKQREAGDHQRLVAFKLEGRGIPRHGNPVQVDGDTVGVVTSGTMSPTLREGIGLAYVDAAHSKLDTQLQVLIRGSPAPARVVKLPFV